MNEQEKKEVLESYKKEKEKGVLFFPDLLVKDAVLALLLFIALVAVAYFIGAPLEEQADPGDTAYTPRPEWYFLFLFQLLKYFPGSLEVIGVFVLPTIAILLLIALPFLDKGTKRHFLDRPVIISVTALVVVGIIGLTIQALREAPPPAEGFFGDPTARLYQENCAGCHGPSIDVSPDTNLHQVISQGRHLQGMPAWNADLSTDEIDALAGFISSPNGSRIFNQNCAECHEAEELVASDSIELRQAIETGLDYAPHSKLDVADWSESLSSSDQAALLNFLVAPDGQRLFTINCAPCHGQSVSFTGSRNELEQIIREGGLHLEMPPWRDRMSGPQIDRLAEYVVDPDAHPETASEFEQYCSSCHGDRVPSAPDFQTAQQTITYGGGHEMMPVWGEVLTDAQIAALVSYTQSAAQGTSTEIGRELFTQYCSSCHGDFGEGGVNPARPGDVIAPISTAEYLRTRDDVTLRAIISQGQPNFGMSPFGTSYGGPLEQSQIDAIVAFLRSWEANPPVELPPEIEVSTVSAGAGELFQDLCAQCHGENGTGGIGPSLVDATFQSQNSDSDIFTVISEGHPASPMIAWGSILTSDQIEGLVQYIRELDTGEQTGAQPSGPPSFEADVLPIFDQSCRACHGSLGGWDSSTYDTVMESGDHAPVIIPGDPDNSLLVQKMLGTQSVGGFMPPSGLLPESKVQAIIDWIAAGAPAG
jgi:menaquinol-cytochrome c reductase cytochrome b/c subunit